MLLPLTDLFLGCQLGGAPPSTPFPVCSPQIHRVSPLGGLEDSEGETLFAWVGANRQATKPERVMLSAMSRDLIDENVIPPPGGEPKWLPLAVPGA